MSDKRRNGSSAGHRYDACIIGSGASGAVVASELVAAGWDVLVVEQGDHVAGGTYLHELIPTFETARARDNDGAWTDEGYPWTACCVGGGTRFYAGISLRLRRVDFDASDHVVADALPPAWPFGYDDLEPHYDWVERRIGITSHSDLDPSRPSRTLAVLPPHPPSLRAAALATAARGRGLQPFPLPLAVTSKPFGAAPVCSDLTTCTDFVCPTGAKGDVYQRLLAPMLGSPNFELRARLKALRLEERGAGHVSELHCRDLDSGRDETIRASLFVVAANAIQSSALLLRSTSAHSPNGLGNGHDMVGRGLCMKVGQNVYGRLSEGLGGPIPVNGGRWATIGITDFYEHPDCPTGLGGLIYDTGPLDEGWRDDPRILRLECLLADQPMASNRVLVDGERVTIDYRAQPTDLRRLAFLREHATELLRDAGAREVVPEPMDFTFGSGHLHGTCRMGEDVRTSVCAPSGRVHGFDNLVVADGSLMPFPGAVNPTLTIQATAHRVVTGLLADA